MRLPNWLVPERSQLVTELTEKNEALKAENARLKDRVEELETANKAAENWIRTTHGADLAGFPGTITFPKRVLALAVLILPLFVMAQAPPYIRNFFDTNANPVVQVTAGSNVFVGFTQAGQTRTYKVDVPASTNTTVYGSNVVGAVSQATHATNADNAVNATNFWGVLNATNLPPGFVGNALTNNDTRLWTNYGGSIIVGSNSASWYQSNLGFLSGRVLLDYQDVDLGDTNLYQIRLDANSSSNGEASRIDISGTTAGATVYVAKFGGGPDDTSVSAITDVSKSALELEYFDSANSIDDVSGLYNASDGSRVQFTRSGNTYFFLKPGASGGTTPYKFDTLITKSSGKLFELKNNGTNVFSVSYNGVMDGNASDLTNNAGFYFASTNYVNTNLVQVGQLSGPLQLLNTNNASNLTNLNASQLTSGTVPTPRMPTLLATNTGGESVIWTNGALGTKLVMVPGLGLVKSNAITGGGSLLAGTNGGLNIGGFAAVGPGNIVATNVIGAKVFTNSVIPLTFSGTNVTVNFSLGNKFSLTLSTNAYFVQPTSLTAMQDATIDVRQDGTGKWTVGFDTNYWKFPSGQILTTTTNANSWSVISCIVGQYATNVACVQTLNFQ